MVKPLKGILVVALEQAVAGPYCKCCVPSLIFNIFFLEISCTLSLTGR